MYRDLAVQILILAVLLLLVPTVVGGIATGATGEGTQDGTALSFRWVSGQIILWAGFQVICVPMILAERRFQDVVVLFSGYMAAMMLLAVAVDIRHRSNNSFGKRVKKAGREKDMVAFLLWGSVVSLVLVQLVLACLLSYEEGDDAFYVAVSTITADADTMYQTLPYTGGTTGLDARHGLAPMPIWVAYLARISGMQAVTVAQVVLPLTLIVMTYGIYLLLGKRLFPDGRRKLPLFLLAIQVLVLFGGYSVYSAENFLLVRTAQGKSIMANIVIPFLMYLFLVILEQLQSEKRSGAGLWLMTGLTMVAGCLCTTQGALLSCVLLGAAGLCMIACYRRWRLILPLIGCGIVPICCALFYFWLG